MSDDKYVTFKRENQISVTDGYTTMFNTKDELPDAVVIRRQDLFASPALATYASMIAIAARLLPDEAERRNLLDVSDYFQRMSELAADEGHKLPTV